MPASPIAANNGAPIGELNADNRAVLLDAGPFFRDARDIGGMIVAMYLPIFDMINAVK